MKVLAIDLGASSGRAILGVISKSNLLELEEIYRFENGGIQIFDSLYWDVLGLFQEIKKSLRKYVDKHGSNLDSIGVDTWGVDFALLDENDELLGPVHHYRDKRTDGMLEEMFKAVPKEDIFNQTGVQFLPINASTQIFSMIKNKSPRLSITRTFLMLPDFFNFLLSGVKASEYSDATTSQLYDPIKNQWSLDLIRNLGLKTEWFCKIIQPGTVLGHLKKYIAEDVGLGKDVKIIAPLTHDTGSAVAAAPVDMNKYQREEWAYLSSGTWSLIGVELTEPLINEKALEHNFTNEGGINGTIRFLKNLTGLWLIQECKRLWDKEGLDLSWEEIEKQAREAPRFKNYINVDDPAFLNPPNMIEAIEEFCEAHGQSAPKSVGEISRTIFESLTFRYKQALENLEYIIEKKIKILHVIGGGSKNALLNQFSANILNITIEAGPIEATAIGNILVQALALGRIKDVYELRKIVKNSFPIKKFEPKNVNNWKDGYKNYLNLF